MRNAWWALGALLGACGSSDEVKSGDALPEVSDTVDTPDTADTAEVVDTSEPPEVTPTSCTINGVSFASGATDPANVCRTCDLKAPNAWTPVADGTDCGAGLCLAGSCIERPRIDEITPGCAASRGGDAISVTGANFASDATATIDGQPASLLWFHDRRVTLTAPASTNVRDRVPVTLTNPDGQSSTETVPFRYFEVLGFQAPRRHAVNAVPVGFAAGDMDGDGKDDLVLSITHTGTLQVARLGQSAGEFGESATLPDCTPSAVAVLEATGDTLADVVAVCVDGLKVYAGTSGGFPTLVEGTPIAMPAALHLVSGHFDDDSVLDLAISYQASNDIALFRGNGDGTFTASGTVSTATIPTWLDAGDLTGDGLDDLAVANHFENRVLTFVASGGGAFSPPLTLDVERPNMVRLDRIDADSLADLVVSAQSVEFSASWFRSLGDGTFADRINFTGGGLIGAGIGDFNEDGFADVIVNSDPGIRLFHGNNDGTFTCSQAIPMNPAPQTLLVGDFDGDGRLDIAGRNPSFSEYTLIMQQAP